jgi:hypothetical protein
VNGNKGTGKELCAAAMVLTAAGIFGMIKAAKGFAKT